MASVALNHCTLLETEYPWFKQVNSTVPQEHLNQASALVEAGPICFIVIVGKVGEKTVHYFRYLRMNVEHPSTRH